MLYAAPTMTDTRGAPVPVLRACVAEVFRDRGAVELARDLQLHLLP